MAEEETKPVNKPSDQGTKTPALIKKVRDQIGQIPSIGDSKESLEHLRKAMEIPPKTKTDSDDKK
jgi:hypothetical protein